MTTRTEIRQKWVLSEFTRNVFTLATGTTISQAIPIALSPLLTRIYTPVDFGVLSLFISITSILGSLANGRYEQAILLPEKEEEAINVTALAISLAVGLSAILLVAVSLFNWEITALLNDGQISYWLYWVPLVVLLTGTFVPLTYLHTRMKNFKQIASANIVKSMVLAVTQVSLGLIKGGVSGLISGQIVSNLAGNSKLISQLWKSGAYTCISRKEMARMAKRFIAFPQFSLWGGFANTTAFNAMNMFLSAFFSSTILGYYSLVGRVLDMPSSLIGSSISQVFMQRVAEEKKLTGSARKTFLSTFLKLLVIAVPAFGLLYFIIEDLFALVFGESWRIAGSYAKILLPLFFIRFIASPLSVIFSVFEKQKWSLSWHVGLLLFTMFACLVAYRGRWGVEIFLSLYTWLLVGHYLINLILSYKVSGGNQ